MTVQAIIAGASAIGKPFTDFLVARERNKLDKEMQRHRNAVTGISSNLQRNATTLQEIDVRQANRRTDQTIQTRAMQDQASAEVSAAAAGVTGGSVQAVMRGLKRSELNAQHARIDGTENAYQTLGQQRKNINISQIFQTDNTVLPGPSVSALLLSMGTAAYDVYSAGKTKP